MEANQAPHDNYSVKNINLSPKQPRLQTFLFQMNQPPIQDPTITSYSGERIHSSPISQNIKKPSPRSSGLLDQLRYQSMKDNCSTNQVLRQTDGIIVPLDLTVSGKSIVQEHQNMPKNSPQLLNKDENADIVLVADGDQKQDNTTKKCDAENKDKLYYYVYGGNYPERIKEALERRGNWLDLKDESQCVEKSHFVWRPVNYTQPGYQRLDKRAIRNHNYPLVYNHFEVLKGLVTKTGLIKSLKHYYCQNDQARMASYQVFDSTPTTFLVPQSLDDSETTEFLQRYKDLSKGFCPKERIPMKHCANNIWLIKPAAANQGRGIEIFNELNDIVKFISTRPKYTCWVVQKYIERPLLFKGRKFDIRVWVLLNAKQEVFLYNEGYLRTSSDDYQLNNGNNYVHLTNNCLQQHGDNYGKHEDGNTVSYQVLQEYLDENFPQHQLSVREHFIPRMKDLIIDTLLSVKTQLNPNKRKNVFEFLGYDFLIDEDFRIWLIEVNTNPYIGTPNAFIAGLLPKMLDDLLALTLDPVHPPSIIPESQKTASNGFELIYSDCQVNHKISPFLGYVNQRRPFNTSMYPLRTTAEYLQSARKTIKTDLKIVEQYRQNISICSVAAYRQGTKQHTSAAEVQNILNSVEENAKLQQSRATLLSQRPQTAKSQSPTKFRNQTTSQSQADKIEDPIITSKGYSPERNSRSQVSKLRLQSAAQGPNSHLQRALQVQPPNSVQQQSRTANLKEQIIKEFKEIKPVPPPQPKYNLVSAQQLRDRLRHVLTVNGKPVSQDTPQSAVYHQQSMQNKLFYLDFENMFKSILGHIKHLMNRKTDQENKEEKFNEEILLITEMLGMVSKADQMAFLERENCISTIFQTISLIYGDKLNSNMMGIAVKLSELIGRLARKSDVQNLLITSDNLLFDLCSLIFLHKSTSTEQQIVMQNLALSLIHSAHLFALDNAKVTLLSPKQRTKDADISMDDQVAIAPSSMSLSAAISNQRQVYIPGSNNRNTNALNARAFETGIVAAFQMCYIQQQNPIKELVQLNLLPFFKKAQNIQRQVKLIRSWIIKIQASHIMNAEDNISQKKDIRSQSRLRSDNMTEKTFRGINSSFLKKPSFGKSTNIVLRYLMESNFLDLDKLLEFNLSFIKDSSPFKRDDNLLRRSFNKSDRIQNTSRQVTAIKSKLDDSLKIDDEKSQDKIMLKSIIGSKHQISKTENKSRLFSEQILAMSPKQNMGVRTQAKKSIFHDGKPVQEVKKGLNEYFEGYIDTMNQTHFSSPDKTAELISQEDTFTQNPESKYINTERDMQIIKSDLKQQQDCVSCFATPQQRKAKLTQHQFYVCKTCGGHKISTSSQFKDLSFSSHSVNQQQQQKLKQLQDQYQRLLFSAESNRSQSNYQFQSVSQMRRSFNNNRGPTNLIIDKSVRRNLLTGSTNVNIYQDRKPISQSTDIKDDQSNGLNFPISPTRRQVTTVASAQQNLLSLQVNPPNQSMQSTPMRILIVKDPQPINSKLMQKSLLQTKQNSGSLTNLFNTPVQQPLKSPNKTTSKRKNSSQRGAIQSHSGLVALMPNFGMPNFKSQKNQIVSLIYTGGGPRPSTTSIPQRQNAANRRSSAGSQTSKREAKLIKQLESQHPYTIGSGGNLANYPITIA